MTFYPSGLQKFKYRKLSLQSVLDKAIRNHRPVCNPCRLIGTKRILWLLKICVCMSVVYLVLQINFKTDGVKSVKLKEVNSIDFDQDCDESEGIVDKAIGSLSYHYDKICRFTRICKEISVRKIITSYPTVLQDYEMESILRTGHHPTHPALYQYSYRPILIPDKKCQTDFHKKVSFLFLIKSSVDNFDRRNAIRATWGDEKQFPFIRRLFFLGLKDKYKEEIVKEAKKHDDIVQYNFMDNYFNNTLKMISAFQWTTKSCQSFQYVVMVDDDYLVITERLQALLQRMAYKSDKYLYMGKLYVTSKPHRSSLSKWYIPVQDYPYDSYPPFLPAGTLIMSKDFIHDVVKLMPYTKPMKFDDCYLGILAYKLNVTATHSPHITADGVEVDSPHFKHLISSHGYGCPFKMVNAWAARESFL